MARLLLVSLLVPLAACGGGEGGSAADPAAGPAVTAAGHGVGTAAGRGTGIAGEERPFTPTRLVTVPELDYRPLYPGKDEPERGTVASFRLEEHAVTNAQFLAFVAANPAWRRSQVVALHADERYLASWPGDLEFPPGLADAPVVQVSWFAARAYAAWIGRRLPTLAEWEAAAAASETEAYGREEAAFAQRILDWYARPMPDAPPAVRSTFRSVHGLWDMHGLVWEWVEDYNTALVTGESRGDSALDRGLFCGSGSIGSADPTDYAAFMRFAYRSSLGADYTVRNLGFRCASDLSAEPVAPCCAAAAEPQADPLPEASLHLLEAGFTSADGRPTRMADLRGRPVILAMMFTHCEYACPRLLADLQGIEEALSADERDAFHWVLVSFDTERDLPEVLAAYASRNKLDARWTLLHGGHAEVRELAAALGVQYKRTPTGAFAHSNRITILDAEGVPVGNLDGLGVPAEDGVRLARQVLRDHSP